jgi:hypothetical protein
LYYYLASSLPMLFYETERFPAPDAFVELCRQHVAARDYRLLLNASIYNLKPARPSRRCLELWRCRETALRNELVKLRTKGRAVEADRYLRDAPVIISVQNIVRDAFAQDSPLAAEDILNRGRWSYLDELLIYSLRLQILQRKALFDEQKGLEAFEQLYATVTSPIYAGSPGGEN